MNGVSLLEKARAYHAAVSAHDSDLVEKMVREDYVQHNPHVPTGRVAFLALLPRLREHGTRIENVRIFQDGSHVIMHHLWKNAAPFGADEKVAFHIIRFDPEGLIAEHWSVMADVEAVNPSGRTSIDGVTAIEDLGATAVNQARVAALFSRLTRARFEEFAGILPRYFAPAYAQHDPEAADGIEGFVEAAREGKVEMGYHRQHRVFGAGNFVLSICEGSRRGKPSAIYDLFRLDEGMIVEHWSVHQEIPAAGLANENGMFGF